MLSYWVLHAGSTNVCVCVWSLECCVLSCLEWKVNRWIESNESRRVFIINRLKRSHGKYTSPIKTCHRDCGKISGKGECISSWVSRLWKGRPRAPTRSVQVNSFWPLISFKLYHSLYFQNIVMLAKWKHGNIVFWERTCTIVLMKYAIIWMRICLVGVIVSTPIMDRVAVFKCKKQRILFKDIVSVAMFYLDGKRRSFTLTTFFFFLRFVLLLFF